MAAEALQRLDLTVMSCRAAIIAKEVDESALAAGAARLDELEQRWSRFRDDSEISGLNRAHGAPRRCSNDTVRLVQALVQAWHATSGAFDPTLLGTLVELGYASSRSDSSVRTSLAADVAPAGRPDLILVDPVANVVRLPVGTTLDPGGLGKGLAADLVADDLRRAGASRGLVEIGGDLRSFDTTPSDGSGWTVAVEHPLDGRAELVRLREGGIATSTSRLRTWVARRRLRHHLLDPDALVPTDGDVVGCTVIAGTAAWAEAFTKMAFVRGTAEALEAYEARGLAARIVTSEGSVLRTAAWAGFAFGDEGQP